jgi:hypothetical protein
MEKHKTTKRDISYEGTSFVSSFMRDLVRYVELQLNKGGPDKEKDIYFPRRSGPT